jgi:hypothetical protein
MWTCLKCKEVVADNFDICWNCGTTQNGHEDLSCRNEEDSPAPNPRDQAAMRGRFARGLLTVAAWLSLFGCAVAVVGGFWSLTQPRPLEGLAVATLAFVYQAAMFVVFAKVRRL